MAEGLAIYTITAVRNSSAKTADALEAKTLSDKRPDSKPEIDLGSHQYSWRDKRTGKMVRDLSPRFSRNWMIVSLFLMGYVFWNRGQVSPDLLFGAAAFTGLLVGIFAANWLRNIY